MLWDLLRHMATILLACCSFLGETTLGELQVLLARGICHPCAIISKRTFGSRNSRLSAPLSACASLTSSHKVIYDPAAMLYLCYGTHCNPPRIPTTFIILS